MTTSLPDADQLFLALGVSVIKHVLVVPVLVQRSHAARGAPGVAPLLATPGTARSRVERVPHGVAAGAALPLVRCARPILTQRATDLHVASRAASSSIRLTPRGAANRLAKPSAVSSTSRSTWRCVSAAPDEH